MNLSYNGEKYIFSTSVRDMVEFLLRFGDLKSGGLTDTTENMLRGTRIHRKLQNEEKKNGSDYTAEKKVSFIREYDRFTLKISGIIDGVGRNETVTVDEIKTTSIPSSEISWGTNVIYDAQLMSYAYILAAEEKLSYLTVRLIYFNFETEEVKCLIRENTYNELEVFFEGILEKLVKWIELQINNINMRNESIVKLSFPFSSYRYGQREFSAAVYRSIKNKNKLYVEAPTGMGKTISVLFPAIKALGLSLCEKIFYLTAKNITGNVAADAVKILSDKGLSIRSINIIAKEKICLDSSNCLSSKCKYSLGHYDRINDALFDLVSSETTITQEKIIEYAEKYIVCPFELSLDSSLFCDVIICDYNYAFDPNASLQRYFKFGGNYVLLVDEAHNLTERSREMFSAIISVSELNKAAKELKNCPFSISRAFRSVSGELRKLWKYTLITEAQKETELSEKLINLVYKLCEKYKQLLSVEGYEKEKDASAECFFNCLFFTKIYEKLTEHIDSYRIYSEKFKNDISYKLFCADPSELICEISKLITSSVFFSATFRPFKYYYSMLGGGKEKDTDKYIRFSSPFPKENLCVMLHKGISTRYKDRDSSYNRISDIISSAIGEKIGNYFIFFPSFKYMMSVKEIFETVNPDTQIIVQGQNMSIDEKENYLSRFSDFGMKTLVAFAVSGGIFSEGIDLSGEKLSGAIIVGTGLPQISFERDLLKKHFSDELESIREGYNYAYTYPGLNRVFQAAGRVIRNETDRGFVLLIDDRYSQASHKAQFPKEWETAYSVKNEEDIKRILRSFWAFK